MKRWIWLVIGIVIVGAGVAIGLVHHHRGTSTPAASNANASMSTMQMNSSAGSDASSATPTVVTSTVTIKDFSFGPQNITVKMGTKVTWTNKDSTSHTVSADVSSSNAPSSSEIAPGGSFSFTFNMPGTYTYHCAIHPSMQGTVTVTK